jgi:cytoskeletal protein RodZ
MKEWSRLKKLVVISAVTLLGIGAIGAASPQQQNIQTTNPNTGTAAPITAPNVQGVTTQNPVQTTPTQSTPTADSTPAPVTDNCPSGTYVNSDGITVCSPYSAPSAPAGATAQCVDGTYSFSLHHSGTCSHHGGVATWL